MKKRRILLRIGLLLLAIPIVVISCKKLDDNKPVTPQNESSPFAEKMLIYDAEMGAHEKSVAADLIYSSVLCPESDIYAEVGYRTISYPEDWVYYKFYGHEGQAIEVHMVRVDCEMDAAYTLFFGTSTTTEGIWSMGSTNTDLEYVTFRDDNLPRPAGCEGVCFAYWDPNYDIVLPYTGWYTLGAYDFIGCGDVDPLEYHLWIVGLAGCNIVIDGCDSYVQNQYIGDGMYMQDFIDECAENAKNHGKFVSCVAHLTNGWVSMGLITQEEKDAVMACAAQSGIPF